MLRRLIARAFRQAVFEVVSLRDLLDEQYLSMEDVPDRHSDRHGGPAIDPWHNRQFGGGATEHRDRVGRRHGVRRPGLLQPGIQDSNAEHRPFGTSGHPLHRRPCSRRLVHSLSLWLTHRPLSLAFSAKARRWCHRTGTHDAWPRCWASTVIKRRASASGTWASNTARSSVISRHRFLVVHDRHGFQHFFGMHASLDIPPYYWIENERLPPATDSDRSTTTIPRTSRRFKVRSGAAAKSRRTSRTTSAGRTAGSGRHIPSAATRRTVEATVLSVSAADRVPTRLGCPRLRFAT